MTADVFFCALAADPAAGPHTAAVQTAAIQEAPDSGPALLELAPARTEPRMEPQIEPQTPDMGPILVALARQMGLPAAGGRQTAWAFKVQLSAPGIPPAVPAAWIRTLAGISADGGAGSFACDTLSITTRGLDTPQAMAAQAAAQGFGSSDGDLPFVVADEAQFRNAPAVAQDVACAHGELPFTLAAALRQAQALAVLTPVRPHPHLGFQGAVSSLGLGLGDRRTKLRLHRDVRPRVDTPLCAGCGSCLEVCLFDAIAIRGGRAFIDHQRCTGCGECMSVCFMAGISGEEARSIPAFQRQVAVAAVAARQAVPGPAGYFNLLVGLDRHAAGAGKRRRTRLADLGILGSRDPVALDQATWDLIGRAVAGPLKSWNGYAEEPEALLDRAQEVGLGSRVYRLRRA